MENIKKISPKLRSFVDAQISISERADQEIKKCVRVPLDLLEQRVGLAAYARNGYSKDFEESGILDMEKLKKINPARQRDSFGGDGKINL